MTEHSCLYPTESVMLPYM